MDDTIIPNGKGNKGNKGNGMPVVEVLPKKNDVQQWKEDLHKAGQRMAVSGDKLADTIEKMGGVPAVLTLLAPDAAGSKVKRLPADKVRTGSPVYMRADGYDEYTLIGLDDAMYKGMYSEDKIAEAITTHVPFQQHVLYLAQKQATTWVQLLRLMPLFLSAGNSKAIIEAIKPRLRDNMLAQPAKCKEELGGYYNAWYARIVDALS